MSEEIKLTENEKAVLRNLPGYMEEIANKVGLSTVAVRRILNDLVGRVLIYQKDDDFEHDFHYRITEYGKKALNQ